MKILVLNGSPKGKRSNTYRITDAFLNGMKTELGEAAIIETVEVAASRIEPCKGCFGCWTATPGKCVIRDDMDELLPKIVDADLIVWSFPLYYYGMPSIIKALLDRNLPLNLPFMTQRPDGCCTHPRRYEGKIADHVLISTCGFYSIENNYEALTRQFDILFGNYTKILCPEGELFAHKELDGRTEEYLSYADRAGREYAAGKSISDATMEKLSELLYAPDQFVEMANASWEIQDETNVFTKEEKERSAAERFTRQMAATYCPQSFDGTQRVFEIYYTDAKVGFQLVMGRERCEVRAESAGPYTTRVETPLTVWQDLSRGVYSGEQAMMEGKYKTLGDLKLLISWGRYFGSNPGRREEPKNKPRKKTNLTLLILPWFVIWLLLTIHPIIGGIAGILAAVGIHFANLKWELTIYDDISCFCVSVFSLLALLRFNLQIVVPLAYLSFGVMWLLSCATQIPLTAHYSKENYNGDDALKNPLFMKTNLILTVCWGVLYLVTPIWTYFIMGSSMPYLTALANTICPAILGVFTNWFEKWYPAKIARG